MKTLVKHIKVQINNLIKFFYPLLTSLGATFLVLITLLFHGCSTAPDRSVEEFVQKTKAAKSRNIEPLPVFTKVEPYKYTASYLRSPFEAKSLAEAEKPKAKVARPDAGRSRELLESFPLDVLKFVGTIQRSGNYWALIKDPNGFVHHVAVGNYIGENFGKIVKIEEKTIEIKEYVLDSSGNYRERAVKLVLSK